MGILRTDRALKELQKIPLNENYHQRARHLASVDMPLDFLIAGELAQIQTFGIPSISKILHRTRQYEEAGTKRLDDTRAILTECMTDTVHSERGKTMVEHLNFIHSFYPITNDDYLYTLALFMVEPVRWCKSFGYRQLDNEDKTVLYLEFKDLGQAMNIQDIPKSYEAMEAWYLAYRRKHMTFEKTNSAVTHGLLQGMQRMFPAWLRPLTAPFIKPVILTLINDPELLEAVGLKAPPRPVRGLIKVIMKTRAYIMKVVNHWQVFSYEESIFYLHYATYPNGYRVGCLGPEKILKQRDTVGCPIHHSSFTKKET